MSLPGGHQGPPGEQVLVGGAGLAAAVGVEHSRVTGIAQREATVGDGLPLGQLRDHTAATVWYSAMRAASRVTTWARAAERWMVRSRVWAEDREARATAVDRVLLV